MNHTVHCPHVAEGAHQLNNGFKALTQLWFSVYHMKCYVVIEQESEKEHLTLSRQRRDESSGSAHSDNDVTGDMKSSRL